MFFLIYCLITASEGEKNTLVNFINEWQKSIPQNRITAFTDINVVPMDEERIIKNQTIIVEDGIIKTIGDYSNIVIPKDALKIQSQGKYLMPGLVYMHVHFNSLLPIFGIDNEWALYLSKSVGKRADLILLNKNPLDDVTNIKNPVGVMVRGKWVPQSQLNKILDFLVPTTKS